MISTKNDASTGPNLKPTVVNDYNTMKGFVDQSDQMTTYTPFVRKTCKWWIRIFFHLITQTALVSAWKLYKDMIGNIKINDFKKEIVESLLETERVFIPSMRHKLEELKGPKAKTRKRCSNCYSKSSQAHGRLYALSHTRRVNSRCNKCHSYLCIDCFNKSHKICD